jgi:hypothetical protein
LVLADTKLALNAGSTASISVNDSLILNTNAIISANNNLTTEIGRNVTVTGTLISTPGSGIDGAVKRGQFTVGSDSLFNPLPVSLTAFAARLKSSDVILSWSTASEVNNKGFEVERSTGKGEWKQIG